MEPALTYLEGANDRKAHVCAAIDAAGGNKAVADRCGVKENAPAQWKLNATVPKQHCETLVELSRGLFKPERVRRNWHVERESMRQLAEHAAG